MLFRSPPIAEIIVRIITFLVAMAVHEFAHAYVAYRMGDTTARDMGRMTLNPFKNINWYGFVTAIVIGFGVLGSAPVVERRMRNPRLGMLLAVAAGPFSNLLLAALFAIPFWIPAFRLVPDMTYATNAFIPTFSQLLTSMLFMNVGMFIFNLLPFFPLDGWTVMLKLLPPEVAYKIAPYAQYSMYALFILIFLPFFVPQLDFLSRVVLPPIISIIDLLLPS